MISDFWGVEVGQRLQVKAHLLLPGRESIGLRPLSMERLMRIMELKGPELPTKDELESMQAEQVVARFADLLRPAAFIALGCDVELPPAAVVGAFQWFMKEHNWPLIVEELLKPPDEGAPASTGHELVDLLYTVEVACGRTIEEQLSMRPEAWLSLLRTMERRVARERANLSGREGDEGERDGSVVANGIGIDDLFTLIPGGEVVEFPRPAPEEG